MAINSLLISTSPGAPVFTCPGDLNRPEVIQEHAVTCMMFCNTGDNPVKLSVHYIKNTELISNRNRVVNSLEIPAGETFTIDSEKVILETGDTIYAIADMDGLAVTVSTMRVS
jgi:hypothetical protein